MSMTNNDTISYNAYIDNSEDKKIWKPIPKKEIPKYLNLIKKVKTTLLTGTKKEKGDALEHLMTFIYNRFKAVKVYENVFKGDNQIDHILRFIDGATPTFIHNNVGLVLIGESKNHNKSISTREVSNLDELLRSKESKLGIFSSAHSFSRGKNMWTLSEGKRRKLAIASNRKIIGFTINELESLTKENFYTLLKRKYYNLVDEIDDCYLDIDMKLPYNETLYNAALQFYKLNLIDDTAFNNVIQNIESKYGLIESQK